MANDEDTREEANLHPEESQLTLRREFAKAALMGIMGEATKERMGENEIAMRCWRVADSMLAMENEEDEPAPPPPPQRGPAGRASQGRPTQRRPGGR